MTCHAGEPAFDIAKFAQEKAAQVLNISIWTIIDFMKGKTTKSIFCERIVQHDLRMNAGTGASE